ncbi:MAG: Rossmann fold nucleotide-binding protein [Nocardioidaceae bacterium]
MRRTRGRVISIRSLADFDRRMAAGATRISGWRLHTLDLSERSEDLARCRLAGASFLGCVFAEGDADRVRRSGALVVPAITQLPVDVYRCELYTAQELYDDPSYAHSLDARAYAWSQQPFDQADALARTLHDHAIDEALAAWAKERDLVGVMGGHAAQRGQPAYADAAWLGHALGQAHVVATGGGPGTMEAANLGGAFARRSLDELDEALAMLAGVPSFRPSVPAWALAAFEVRARFPDSADSLGIPTWHYGHEPPNVFATAIAKFFDNPAREALLLEVCDAGIVFLPGAGGTVQEVFQDACENYYADETSVAPMVLVGTAYWTDEVPVWPLLRALARGRVMEPHIHLVDSIDEAAAVIGS